MTQFGQELFDNGSSDLEQPSTAEGGVEPFSEEAVSIKGSLRSILSDETFEVHLPELSDGHALGELTAEIDSDGRGCGQDRIGGSPAVSIGHWAPPRVDLARGDARDLAAATE